MKPNWHYYESHVELGDMSAEEEKALIPILEEIEFTVTDLTAIKREGLESQEFHMIVTAKGQTLDLFRNKLYYAVYNLKNKGYRVLRYKLESTILDSKYEDVWRLL